MITYTRCSICGNIGRDPELAYTPSGAAKLGFNICVTTRFKDTDHSNWMFVTLWGKLAENIAKLNPAKGDMLQCDGLEFRVSEYEKDGEQKRFHTFESTFGTVVNVVKKGTASRSAEDVQPDEDDDLPF